MASKGVGIREISRILKVSRNTVRCVIKGNESPETVRESKYTEHLQEIKELLRECRGNIVRVQEELELRHNIIIPYQSLTWLIRKYEIGKKSKKKKRSGEYVFELNPARKCSTTPLRTISKLAITR